MAKYITEQELAELKALGERWELLNAGELNRLLLLCESAHSHINGVLDAFGGTDPENFVGGLSQVIAKIQERLEVKA